MDFASDPRFHTGKIKTPLLGYILALDSRTYLLHEEVPDIPSSIEQLMTDYSAVLCQKPSIKNPQNIAGYYGWIEDEGRKTGHFIFIKDNLDNLAKIAIDGSQYGSLLWAMQLQDSLYEHLEGKLDFVKTRKDFEEICGLLSLLHHDVPIWDLTFGEFNKTTARRYALRDDLVREFEGRQILQRKNDENDIVFQTELPKADQDPPPVKN